MFSRFCRFILVPALAFLIGCAVNPISGKNRLMLISQEQDIAMGKEYAPEVEKELGGRISDEKLQRYINDVGQKIAAVCHNHNFEYHYTALNDKMINAFALPGGYIFVTKGMLEKLKTEAQLASLLAHETVHVVARHTSEAISRDIGINIIISSVASENTSQAILTVVDFTNQILYLKYSRDNEKQADLGGLDYMVDAGYNPNGMVELMKMLQDESKTRPIEFFSTHPSPDNRMEYITEKIQAYRGDFSRWKIGAGNYQKYVLKRLDD